MDIGSYNPKHNDRPLSLSVLEDFVILKKLMRFSSKRIPLPRTNITESIFIFVLTMSEENKAIPPCINGVPGRKYVWISITAQKVFTFWSSEPAIAKAVQAYDAEFFTSRFAQVHKPVIECNSDANRIWNLHESGNTSGRDEVGNTKEKLFAGRMATNI